MKKIGYLLMLCAPLSAASQTTALQDKAGETSIAVFGNKSLVLNSGDASFSAGLSFARAAQGRQAMWGFNLKLKSNDGVSKLLNGTDFKPKYDLSMFTGWFAPNHPNGVTNFFYVGAGINQSNFKLSPSASADLVSSDFFGGFIKGGYNHTGNVGSSSTVFGLSLELGKYDNLSDLDDVDRYRSTVVGSNVMLTDKTSGFTGNYMTSAMTKVKLDYMVYPRSLGIIGLGAFYRGGIGGTFARQNAGVGIFAGNANAPGNVVGGIVFQVNDIFDQLQQQANFAKRTGLSIVAGYNF